MSISMKRYNDTIITPKDDRILFDQIFDDYGLIYGGSATMAASNKIHVGAARGFIKGTEVIIEAEDIAVNLSDSGTKNGRLKIVMDLADTETPIKFESEVAASFQALEQDANINYDNGRYEVVFATYKATETTISSVALVMPTMQSVKAKIQGINQSLTYITSQDVVVGTLNGKDLHRRTYNLVKADNLQSVIIDTSIKAGDVDYVLNIYGTFRNSLGNWYSLSHQSSARVEVLLSYKGVELVINNISVNKMIVVIEYTLV